MGGEVSMTIEITDRASLVEVKAPKEEESAPLLRINQQDRPTID